MKVYAKFRIDIDKEDESIYTQKAVNLMQKLGCKAEKLYSSMERYTFTVDIKEAVYRELVELQKKIDQVFQYDEDTEEDMAYLVKKITQMRIFEDEAGKMNLSLKDVDGELLIISQFTLFASTKKGNRPSFTEAGAPDFSKDMYLKFIAACRDCGIHTEEGEFGAHMMVSLVNDGPVTITIDSKQRH